LTPCWAGKHARGPGLASRDQPSASDTGESVLARTLKPAILVRQKNSRSLVHLGSAPIILSNWKKNPLCCQNLLVVILDGWYKHASLGSEPGLPGPWLEGFL
jgi:hypothetical protein